MGPQQHRFVFIGGLPRSGTTFLARSVARYPGVSDLEGTSVKAEEGQFLQDVYPLQKDAGGVDRFAYSPTMHLTESSPQASEASRDALWNAWSPFWDTEQPLLLEKTPSNLLRMRFLQAIFPSSSFIVIVRHPVAQAMALRARGWSDRNTFKLIDHWVAAHDVMRGDLEGLERVIVIRYEDLITDPRRVMAGVQTFLGLDGSAPEQDVEQGLNGAYFEQWRNGGMVASLVNRRTIRRFESHIGRYGYSFSSEVPVGPLAPELPTLA